MWRAARLAKPPEGLGDVTGWYGEDLAYIYDVGHADFALQTAPGILEILRENGVRKGLVVDPGCGSGLLARGLLDAGYRVHGIDISEAMVRRPTEEVQTTPCPSCPRSRP